MQPTRYLPDVEFAPASAGTRVRLATIIALTVIVVIATVVSVVVPKSDPAGRWIPFVAPLIALPIMLIYWHGSHIRRYRLKANELLVERAWLTARFPLEGLQTVIPDREALRGAFKIIGNDGLGAIAGRFYSKRLGQFRAYVTDPGQAVILRWPDRCLVISPLQVSFFIETVRKRAGLSR